MPKHNIPWSTIVYNIVLNLFIIGPCFFLASTMGLAVLTGGTFTIGTHMLMYWEAIVYSVTGMALTLYAFINFNFNKEIVQ